MIDDTKIIQTICHSNSLSKSAQRALVLHILYTIEMHEYVKSLESIIYDYARAFACSIEESDTVFYHSRGIINFKDQADVIIESLLQNWKIDRLSIITKLILRYALWELISEKQDAALIINESVELAKGFGEEDSYRLINGLMDNASKQFLKDSSIE